MASLPAVGRPLISNNVRHMKIGLVLSGGGARGISHLGMIQALEEEGVEFHSVSGVSAGALAGAFYCAGYSPADICDILVKTKFLNTFRPAFNWRSLLNIQRASLELKKYFPENSFEALEKPLYVTTTDVRKGKVKVFKKGMLIEPVLASCSIPVVFDPIKIGSRILVDGGILDNLPIDPIRKKVDRIVGMHCNPIDPDYMIGNWRDLMERSFLLTATTLAYTKKEKCDVFLEPSGLCMYHVFDFKKVNGIFQCGYDYAKAEIEKGILDSLIIK